MYFHSIIIMISLHNDIFTFYICKYKNRQKFSICKRERFWTFTFGAGSLFRHRSKNKRGHGTDVDVQGRRIVCLGESHAFTHVREGHAPVDVAHTRMARRRTNQYQTIPGVHPNRCDRQSASTPSAINHTFRYFGAINYIPSTEEKHRLD